MAGIAFSILAVNTVAGVLLAGLGWLLAVRSRSLALPLFLVAWGADLALRSLPFVAPDPDFAIALSWASLLLMPLQGLLLLCHVLGRTTHPALRSLCKAAILAIIMSIITFVVRGALSADELFSAGDVGALALVDLDMVGLLVVLAPQVLGVTLALILLSRTFEHCRSWLLIHGVSMAWVSSFSYQLSDEVASKPRDLTALVILSIGVIGLAGAIIWQFIRVPTNAHANSNARPSGGGHLPLVMWVGVLLFVLLPPGVFLASIGTYLFVVLRHGKVDAEARMWNVPVGGTFGAIFLAAAIGLLLLAPIPVPARLEDVLQGLGLGYALAAIVVIVGLSIMVLLRAQGPANDERMPDLPPELGPLKPLEPSQ